MTKRIILCILILPLLALIGCSGHTMSANTLVLDGQVITVPYVVRIDNYEVKADEYRYYYLNLLNERTADTDDRDWSHDESNNFKDTVLEYLLLERAAHIYATDLGIVFTDEDAVRAESEIEELRQGAGGNKEFLSELSAEFLTERLLLEQIKAEIIYEKLYNMMFDVGGIYEISESEMLDIVKENYVCVRYLMLSKNNENHDSEEFARDLLERINNGTDFVTLVNEYGEDLRMLNNPDGYYFTYGMLDDHFTDICFSLEVGEISEVVDSEGKLYIIKRQPIDDSYVKETIDVFIKAYKMNIFQMELQKISQKLSIEYSDIYEAISPFSMS